MENVRISKVCGLCAGCRFAINSALNQLQKGKKVTLFKEIVHNKNVTRMLEGKGIFCEDNLENLTSSDIVIIRAHGEPPSTFDYLNKNNISFLDCTCYNVKKIHEQIALHNKMGYIVVIVGKYGKLSKTPHPEILGSIGYSSTEPILIEDIDDISKLDSIKTKKVFATFQTTFNEAKANLILSKIQKVCEQNSNELKVYNSICSAQKMINKASVSLAKECDVMIVVGGKNSSNTKELYENVKNYTQSIFLEDILDWDKELKENGIKLSKTIKIGLTAGASTMNEELVALKELIETEIKNQGEINHG